VRWIGLLRLAPRTPCYCYYCCGSLSVPLGFSISCDAHRLRSAFTRIVNTAISDSQWFRLKMGVWGIRQVLSLALHAYLDSAASTSDLSLRFCRSLPAPLISTLILTSPVGKQPSVHCQRLIRFLACSPFGTAPVSWHLEHWSSLPFLNQYK